MMRHFAVIAVAGLLVGTATASAVGDQGKGKDKDKGKGHHDDGSRVVFVDTDRGAVRTYWVDTYGRGNCPPGLAKKGNGCQPPGQARKLWVVGQPLPPTVIYYPLPPVLVQQLAPVPPGYEYVQVDNDVLLMDMANRLVADAVSDLYELD